MSMHDVSETSSVGMILHHLHRNGRATVKELEQVIGVSTTAVREHMIRLQAEGLVVGSSVRRGAGRPHFIYTLTAKGHRLFPKQYDLLINLILEELAAEEGVERVVSLLDRVGSRLATEYAAQIDGSDLPERLVELQFALAQRGVPAQVGAHSEKIELYACPYLEVAQVQPHLCQMDARMFARATGEHIILQHTIRDGHATCCFVVSQDDDTTHAPREDASA